MPPPVIQVRDVVKDYRGLRPLRVRGLDVEAGQAVALMGLDQAAAEVLVNLLTGAMLPDSGTITVFGQSTASITEADRWVAFLDQFGLISERAMFLDELTAEQNLAMPLSLEVKTMAAELRDRVRALAAEVALDAAELVRPLGALAPLDRQRVRLGRALALDPRVLLAEHANAPLSGPDTLTFAADLSRVATGRGIALVAVTANREFATSITPHVLALQPATGELTPAAGWRRWFF